jgi:hypothetical protein
VAILLVFALVYPLLELGIWFGFLLDNLFFRDYQNYKIETPIFIIGNPRSGTTFLHRLLALDQDRFSTMAMWQILFAPSVSQRKMVSLLTSVDRRLGHPLKRLQLAIEERWQDENPMHAISFSAPEEDDYLLLHIWSALTTGLSAGLLEEAIPYTYFDSAVAESDRRRIMEFYHGCVQRHLYATARNSGQHYLAKNPALCPKIGSVWRRFPEARFIYLVRNPLEMVPSYVDMMHFSWRAIGDPTGGGSALRDYVVEMAKHWYSYPLQQLAMRPSGSYVIVRYDELVSNPVETVTKIYKQLDLELGKVYRERLLKEGKTALRYKSRHKYSMASTGLSMEQLIAEFRDIFAQFDFETGLPGDGAQEICSKADPQYTITVAKEVTRRSAILR